MKKNKIWVIVCAVFFALQFIAEALSLGVILKLNMLPGHFTALLVGVYVLGLALTGLLMFLPPKKENGAKVRRTVACILAVLIIVLCFIAYGAVAKLYETMHSITQTPDSSVTRQVYVMADDPAQSIQDAASYTFGIVDGYDEDYTQLAIAAIEDILGTTVTTRAFATVHEMVDALYNGQCGAIILNGGYVGILENDEKYADFTDRTRILYNAPIDPAQLPTEETEPTETTQATEQTEPTVEPSVTNTPFIMYISGIDSRSYYLTTSLSDVNILAIVNPNTHQVLLLNTPRDYYVPNPAGKGKLDKLTHCGISGVENSIKTLSDLYDIDIDYYSRINFTGLEKLVDAMGGITVNSPYGFTHGGHTFTKGINHLNGEQALAFSRERYQLPGGDNARGKNQMRVIQGMIAKLTSGTTILSNYTSILDSLKGLFVTSMEMDEISQLVKLQLSEMPSWDVKTFAVTGKNGRDITYSMPGQGLSVMYQDEAYISYASELVNRVLAGDILTEEDMTLPKA